MRYRVRSARIDDIPAITGIYAREVAHEKASFELDPPDEAEMRRRLERIRSAGYSYLVACQGDHVLGYAYTSEYRSRPGYRFTVEDSVYVSVDARGRGIGTTLLTALIEDCRDRPFRQMIAVIGDSANGSSIRLHERVGFNHAGVLRDVGYKFGQWIDTVMMQRALVSNPQTQMPTREPGNDPEC